MNLIMAKKISLIILFFLGIFFPEICFCQQELIVDVTKITVDKGDLNFWIKTTQNGIIKKGIASTSISITEQLKNLELSDSLTAYDPKDTIVYNENERIKQSTTISFLLDMSREMSQAEFSLAKNLIKQVVREKAQYPKTRFLLTAFHYRTILKREVLNSNNVDQVLNDLRIENYSPDFYRILVDEIKTLNTYEGAKALFILGSGGNATKNSIYTKQLPYTQNDVRTIVNSLPFNFKIFVIAFGDIKSPYFNNFNCLTSENTQISRRDLPLGYSEGLEDTKEILSNYVIKATPVNRVFKGEKRNYLVEVEGIAANKEFRLGSINFPINLEGKPSWTDWLLLFVIGIIAILVILGLGSLLVPFIRERKFINNYVETFREEDFLKKDLDTPLTMKKRKFMDIIYNEPIEEGELVVSKCRQITPFSTWKENGWQCPNYPVCLNHNCSGTGAPESNNFFSMKNVFLKLNWVWFGAMGGLLAWIIISLFRVTNFQYLNSLIGNLVGNNFLSSISSENPELVTQTIGNNVLVGIAFGSGLMFMLSWMEERRAFNKYSFSKSAFRIIIRTVAGIFFSMLVFFGGFYLQYVIGINSYFSGLLSWLLFGLGIGLIISIYSSIATYNGIIGGVLATTVAFHAYWGLSEFLNLGFMQANLLSMILLGAIIGSILVSVVNTLEDYELEVIAPQGYQRTIAISKWLKSSVGVMIGKSPSCYIYIKWEDDEVKPEHAELFTEDGNVFIRPIDEVLLNQRIISKPISLKNGDTIQLGRSSITQFRFFEK